MRSSFAHAPSPLLIGVVREKNIRNCIASIKNCECDGATGIDLHLSCLEEKYKNADSIKKIVSATSLPVLSLSYNQNLDYSQFETDEETRTEILLESAKAGVSAVDVQGYTFDIKSRDNFFGDTSTSFGKLKPKEVVTDTEIIEKQKEFYEKIRFYGSEALLSAHPGVYLDTEAAVDLALFLEKRGPDIIKIVATCENEFQLAESFKTMVTLKNEVKTKVHFHLSGKHGKLSRIVNPLLGGHLIFCSDRYSESSNFEQLDLRTAVKAVENLKKCM